jgi:hypothetical protein
MSIRPILAGACALALIVPAAASARPAVGPFTHAYGGQGVTYGSTAYALQNQRDLGPAAQSQGVTYGDTAYALQNQRDLGVPAPHAPRGLAALHPTPSGVHVVTLTDGQLQAAFIASHPDAKAIPAHLSDAQIAAAFLAEKPTATSPAATANDGSSADWRTAAVIEAALLAALVLCATVVVLSRRRTPSLGV